MTYDIDQLRELERRLSEAKGANFALERMIRDTVERKYHDAIGIPNYTASLDAAIALVERVLGPDVMITTETFAVNAADEPRYRVFHASVSDFGTFTATFERGGNVALALCLALVRALISKSEGKQP